MRTPSFMFKHVPLECVPAKKSGKRPQLPLKTFLRYKITLALTKLLYPGTSVSNRSSHGFEQCFKGRHASLRPHLRRGRVGCVAMCMHDGSREGMRKRQQSSAGTFQGTHGGLKLGKLQRCIWKERQFTQSGRISTWAPRPLSLSSTIS